MARTSPSLLNRLREQPGDGEAWRRFDDIYRPLLTAWLRRYSLQAHDGDDLVQDILQVVIRELPAFRYDPDKGTFRGWLRGVMMNCLRAFWRMRPRLRTGDGDFFNNQLGQLEDPQSDLSGLWDREHDRHVVQRLLTLIQRDFEPVTWQAFRRLLEGEKPAAVAADLKISVNAVYLAKSGVLKRLREEVAGLTD